MIEPSWVGRRVSVRRVVERHADGRLLQSDVVGELLDLDEQVAVIESRAGLVEVPLPFVTIARIAPPSTADELALDRVVADGWRPAEVADLDGWRLRADHGFTKRANSVLPLGQLRRPLDEALEAAREWYAARELPLRFQLSVEARRLLDAELGERRWPSSADTAVLVRRLAGPAQPLEDSAGAEIRIGTNVDDEWLDVLREGGTPRPVSRRLLERHDRVAFASLRVGGRTVAVGRGTVDDGWLGVTCIEVDADHRRQGFASRVMAGLEAWGRQHDAQRAVLEVGTENSAALALYEKRGWWRHHDYRYRVEPAA